MKIRITVEGVPSSAHAPDPYLASPIPPTPTIPREPSELQVDTDDAGLARLGAELFLQRALSSDGERVALPGETAEKKRADGLERRLEEARKEVRLRESQLRTESDLAESLRVKLSHVEDCRELDRKAAVHVVEAFEKLLDSLAGSGTRLPAGTRKALDTGRTLFVKAEEIRKRG